MNQWHKMRSRGKEKKGKLEEHFSSHSHKAALGDLIHFEKQSAHLDIILDKQHCHQAIQEHEDTQNNREAVAILLDI